MLKFLAFADFHYEKMRFSTTVEDLTEIVNRANENSVDFIIHAGDFCGDFKNSPEIIDEYLKNPYNRPCYGVIGNHDLEHGNAVEFVKENLNNREVTFADNTAYWYTDIKGYRIIGLDSNYSFNPETNEWEHDTDFNCRKGNLYSRSLSPKQIKWLDEVLCDAHKNGLKVIVVAHDSFSDAAKVKSPDGENVVSLFEKYPGTVILAINGHYHTDHFIKKNGVCYLDLNTAKVGFSRYSEENHYKENHTFTYTEYKDSKKISVKETPLSDLEYGSSVFMYDEPLSAVITITDDCITIEGSKTNWMYGILPDSPNYEKKGCVPKISDNKIEI